MNDLNTAVPKVCLVMVTFNRLTVLQQSMKAVREQQVAVDYFVVVDNGSTDDTVEHLKANAIDIDLVKLDGNYGYAAGLAVGMQFARAKYQDINFFWLMDDDSHPNPDTLANLIQIKSQFPFNGLLSVTGFVDTIWKGPMSISRYPHKSDRLINTVMNLYEVDHALIDGALVDRVVVDHVGYPDGKFFMMCEDVEYCKRLKRAGYNIVIHDNESEMTRLHYGGGGRFTRSNLWRGYYGARNHLLILKEYFTWRAMITYIIRQSKYLLASLGAKDRFRRIYLRMLGIIHGLKGIEGKTIDPKDF